ncbi:hypothetical protein ACFWPQ_27380 [Streptomyces sp. NPDC058464]|uniref:DUF3885 domain-containing protein n=1 Tax=Streptomyces sp. NPDC058464 TaxID=3346511 RepID=UPI003650847D
MRAVADEALVEVFVADAELRRIHHPYDGRPDIILVTPAEGDGVRDRHTDWLSDPQPASESRTDPLSLADRTGACERDLKTHVMRLRFNGATHARARNAGSAISCGYA